MANIIYKEESYQIIGACFEVYKSKGCGFTEPMYQECLEIEFDHRNIPYFSQPEIQPEYRGRLLRQSFKPDFICFDKIILELKAVSNLIDEHRAQAMNYLNATKFELALLINFGHFPKLEYERLGNSRNYKSAKQELNSWIETK